MTKDRRIETLIDLGAALVHARAGVVRALPSGRRNEPLHFIDRMIGAALFILKAEVSRILDDAPGRTLQQKPRGGRRAKPATRRPKKRPGRKPVTVEKKGARRRARGR